MIEAVLPAKLSPGPARLTVAIRNVTSEAAALRIVASSPGLYSSNEEGWGPAKFETRGGLLRMDVNGLGTRTTDVEVLVGSVPAKAVVTGGGRQIQFEVPRGAPVGCAVPVQMRSGGSPLSNTVTIELGPQAGSCTPPSYFPNAAWDAGPAALVLLNRLSEGNSIQDEAYAAFVDYPGDRTVAGPISSTPPVGACATYLSPRVAEVPVASSLISAFVGVPALELLDAGPELAIHDRSRQYSIPGQLGVAGLYKRVASGMPGPRGLFLSEPLMHVVGRGGTHVGPFRVAIPVAPAFQFDQPSGPAVRRERGAVFEWSGETKDRVMLIIAGTGDLETGASGYCYCVASGAARRFEVDGAYLAHLPPGEGTLMLVSWPASGLAPIRARGLKNGLGAGLNTHIRRARFE